MPLSISDDRLVKYEARGGIGYITLNRPDKLNAISDDVQRQLKEVFLYFDLDAEAQIGIISGAGRAFSSGADVKQRQMRPESELNSFGLWSPDTRRRDLFYDQVNFKPVIGAVHGYAFGAGLGLALRTDVLIAERNAKFQVTEIPRGLGGAGLWAMLRFRGLTSFADEIAMTGREFSGEEGASNGVVNLSTAPGEHLSTAEEYAAGLMKNPPLSVRTTVRARRWQMEQIDREIQVLSEPRPSLHLTEDFKEAVSAWSEKRQAGPYKGR